MRCIGLTGGIATGKSTVATMLAARGAVVVDADILAREVVLPGRPALTEIVAEFGDGVLRADRSLDREALGRIVFADPARRRRLEGITHPRIAALIAERVAAARRLEGNATIVESPLLFEAGLGSGLDEVMLVYAPPATQVARLRARDGLTDGEAWSRLDAQLPIDEKKQLATWVIDNGGSLAQTRIQVEAWWTAEIAPGGGAPRS